MAMTAMVAVNTNGGNLKKGENAMSSSCYHGQTAQFIAVAVQNMPAIPDDLMQWWADNPLELQAFLAGLSQKPSPKLDIWKTIRLGMPILRTADDFLKAIKDGGNRISDWANDLLGKPEFENSISKEEVEVDLVILTTAHLTEKNGGTTAEVFAGAERLGLQKCSAEVGPQLRLQYNDQPNGEWLLIGMEPIRDSDGGLSVFRVEHDDNDLWLDDYCGNPDNGWNADDQWVFVRPRK